MTVCKACACAVSGVIAALRTRLKSLRRHLLLLHRTSHSHRTPPPRQSDGPVQKQTVNSVSGVNLQLSNHISHLDQHSKPDLSKFTAAVRDKGRNTDTDGESDCQSMKTTCLEEERDKERDKWGAFTSRFHFTRWKRTGVWGLSEWAWLLLQDRWVELKTGVWGLSEWAWLLLQDRCVGLMTGVWGLSEWAWLLLQDRCSWQLCPVMKRRYMSILSLPGSIWALSHCTNATKLHRLGYIYSSCSSQLCILWIYLCDGKVSKV
ncbi:hypothetical protein WMY93_031888 [Mugilogobius chulae]|uniref:Uncharacterized protein n=1 Tax=Mugilogobius chulae TaxID=88201 RepID=A0AAW0MFD9_9GOBI